MNRILASLFACLMLSIVSRAQEDHFERSFDQPGRYWVLGIGNSFQSMYDEAISHVRYANSGIGVTLNLVKSSEKKYREWSSEPTFVKLKTKLSNDLRPMEVSTTRIATSYEYLEKIKGQYKNFKFYAGGEISLLSNSKERSN